MKKLMSFAIIALFIATMALFYFDKQNKSILNEKQILLSADEASGTQHYYSPSNAYSTMHYDPQRDRHNDYPGPYRTGYWPNDYRHVNRPGTRDHTYMVPNDGEESGGSGGGSGGSTSHNSAPGTSFDTIMYPTGWIHNSVALTSWYTSRYPDGYLHNEFPGNKYHSLRYHPTWEHVEAPGEVAHTSRRVSANPDRFA